ncbi:protein singed wings 2 [Trichoplusia ni]|uniref:Protein singed wings 2 n=1 Tax=Trichoplusia ni TaxID=7111 RepID=A0A7E5W116_TRINI|nr:protein singed wings 2 [Trichoplusia ni]
MKVISEVLVLFSVVSVVTPGFQFRSRNISDTSVSKHCSLSEFTSKAECKLLQYQLNCRIGLVSTWLRGIKREITHLRLVDWSGECLNVARLQYHFPELVFLELINSTSLRSFKGHFTSLNKIEKLVVHGLEALWEIPPEVVVEMQALREMDLRGNMLRHIKSPLLTKLNKLERIYLAGNSWDCSDGGLDWLAMEPENGTIRRKIIDYDDLVCHQQLYRGKPLNKVMDIIRTMRQTCPEPCTCTMTHVVSDAAGAVIPLITVDCSNKDLEMPPPTLPPGATTLRLEGNKLNTIRAIVHNPQYRVLTDLYLDNNSISAVKELEGTEWFSNFRVLSLRGNYLKQIPVYAFDKAFQVNNNLMHVFLGDNPWRCDCHYIPRFQSLLLKYRRVIRDLPDIKCSKSTDKKTSLAQISTIPLGNICGDDDVMPISPINIVNLVLLALILLVVGRFLYDWQTFKNTGQLPWLSSILP